MLPITLIYLALSHVATAQNATNTTTPECEGEVGVYNSFNITNSTIIPAFEPPGFSPANWTLNFGVSDIRNATDKSSLSEMYMWIDSTDKETDLDSVDLPYTGCIIGYALERRRNSTGDIGTGDGCKGVFTEECYKALVQSATLSASRGLDGGDLKKRCLNALDFTNVKGCDREDGWYAYSSHVIFGNGTSGTNGTDGCSPGGVTEDAKLRFPAWTNSGKIDDNYDNRTSYDNLVSSASPFLLFGIMKNSTDPKGTHGYGEARLVCATPGGIQESSAVSRRGSVYGMVVIGVALALLGVI